VKCLESGYALPTLSPVAVRLVELASDENCSAGDLAELIEKDPSLAVRLIKLANSAFSHSAQTVSTLKQAVVRVGFHRLRVMALSLSLRETFPMGRVGPMDYEKFWKASLYRAILAKSLAQQLRISHPEEAFVSALIQEIGLLIFFDLFLKEKEIEFELELDSLDALLSWQRENYGVDHRMIGEAALRYWKFPENILGCQSIYGDAAKSESAPPLVRICELARVSSRILFHESTGLHEIFEEMESVFGLDQQVVNNVILATFEQVQSIAESVKMEVDREKDLMEILEKANKALSQISEMVYRDALQTPVRRLPAFEDLQEREYTDALVSRTLQAVAHEIRNPIQAVGGFARKLSSLFDPVSEGGQYVQIIIEEAMRLEKALAEMTQREA
jgi:HD-like signal output (HDOD) protein